MERILNYMVKKCQILYVYIDKKETFYYHMMFRKNKKGLLVYKRNILDISQLKQKSIDKSIPCLLVLDGKSTIHKQIAENELEIEKIFKTHYVNSNPEDFYSHIYTTTAKENFLSIMRKTSLDEITTHLKKLDIQVVDIFIGPFILDCLAELIFEQIDYKSIKTPGYLLVQEEKGIHFVKEINSTDNNWSEKITFNGDKFTIYELICFAAAVSYLAHLGVEHINSRYLYTEQSKINFQFKNKIKLVSVPSLSLVFLILIINFFVFNSYSDKLNKYQSIYNINESKIKQLEQISTEIEEKQKLVKQLGLDSKIPMTYYLDRLVAEVPQNIKLNKLEINPLLEQDDEKIDFEKSFILIKGTCIDAMDLNKWVKKIEKYWWLKKTEYIDLKKTNSGNDQFFSIKLLY